MPGYKQLKVPPQLLLLPQLPPPLESPPLESPQLLHKLFARAVSRAHLPLSPLLPTSPRTQLASSVSVAPQPPAQPVNMAAPPSIAVQTLSRVPPTFLQYNNGNTSSAATRDSTFSPARAEVPPPAGAVSNSTPVSGLALIPLSLSRAEFHERYAATQAARQRKNEATANPAQSQAQQPVCAGTGPKQTEELRPSTPKLLEHTAFQPSVASISSSPTVAPAQRSLKPHQSRLRKRHAEDMGSPAEPAAKQAPMSGPVIAYPATCAATISTDAATSTFSSTGTEPPAAVLKPASTVSHTDLQLFARPPSRDLSDSPKRCLHIAEQDVQVAYSSC